MDIARVVETWCAVPGRSDLNRVGTGYLISKDLVLTARHCVNVDGSSIEIRRLTRAGKAQWHQVEVVWPEPEAGAPDIAVLRVTGADWAPGRVKAVRWGRPADENEQLPCLAIGFPDSERASGHIRDTKEIRGSIELLTGFKAGTLAIHVKDSALPKEVPHGTLWSGASGAALFSGPWLVGVIVEAPIAQHGMSALTAAPITSCTDALHGLRVLSSIHAVTAAGVRRARLRLSVQAASVAIAALIAGLVIAQAALQSPPAPLPRLSRLPNVAVVGFASQDSGQPQLVLDDVTVSLTQELERSLTGTEVHDYVPERRLPLSQLAQPTHQVLDIQTKSFADQTNAAIILGGLVSSGPAGQTSVTPAIYVRADQVVDAPELSGWYVSDVIPMDLGWESASGRDAVVSQLVGRMRGLTDFVNALDLWRSRRVNEASDEFSTLLSNHSGTVLQDGGGFVTSDLIHLFRGHALEQEALDGIAANWRSELDAAQADYQAIRTDSPIYRRARLSLAGNSYLRSIGPVPSCRADTVVPSGLERAELTLRELADDPGFTDIGRLKASVNLAQVEQCRVTAGLVPDDGTVIRFAERVRVARDVSGSEELRALAISIEAVHSADSGDLPEATASIKEAIGLERRFVTRGLWLGLLASWSYSRCDLTEGDQARQSSITQLQESVANGEATTQQLNDYLATFAKERNAARTRCGLTTPVS